MTLHWTFRQLESSKEQERVAQSGTSPLEAWYEAVRDKPISAFSYNDLCIACRQQVFPETIIPIAIETLRKDSLAGEMYDGELLAAMSHVGREYWSSHPSQALKSWILRSRSFRMSRMSCKKTWRD